MNADLKEVIQLISERMYCGDNVLEIEEYATLSKLCAKFGVKTDTKELGELYDKQYKMGMA